MIVGGALLLYLLYWSWPQFLLQYLLSMPAIQLLFLCFRHVFCPCYVVLSSLQLCTLWSSSRPEAFISTSMACLSVSLILSPIIFWLWPPAFFIFLPPWFLCTAMEPSFTLSKWKPDTRKPFWLHCPLWKGRMGKKWLKRWLISFLLMSKKGPF